MPPTLHLDTRTLQALGAISALLVGATGGNVVMDYLRPNVSEPMHAATRDAFAVALIEQHRDLEERREENERLRTQLEGCRQGGLSEQ